MTHITFLSELRREREQKAEVKSRSDRQHHEEQKQQWCWDQGTPAAFTRALQQHGSSKKEGKKAILDCRNYSSLLF